MCSHDDLLVSFSGMEKDAVAIFTRFVSPDAVRPIPITEQIRNDIVGERLFLICGGFVFCWHAVLCSPFSALVCAAKICGEDGMVDPNCFVIAQAVVKAILEDQWVLFFSFSREVVSLSACFACIFEKIQYQLFPFCHFASHAPTFICPACSFTCRHFSEFLRSHHYCKYQIEVLTSGSVFLADILFCESALFYFSEVSGLTARLKHQITRVLSKLKRFIVTLLKCFNVAPAAVAFWLPILPWRIWAIRSNCHSRNTWTTHVQKKPHQSSQT